MIEPILLEIQKVKVVPLIAERLHALKDLRLDETRNPVTNRIAMAGGRNENPLDDIITFLLADLDCKRFTGLGVAKQRQDAQ
ncbi:MAG: hypothetical protein INF18_09315 [Methylobacterium sp.]|nr:hypothetical protein [Methylobacterium sp.]MCA3637987.1 hypothetical protein [Methylobacterium sp.]